MNKSQDLRSKTVGWRFGSDLSVIINSVKTSTLRFPAKDFHASRKVAMNFLVTSLLFTKESVENIAGKWGQFATIGTLPLVSLVSLSSQPSGNSNWYKSFDKEVFCACSSINHASNDEAGVVAQGLLSQYVLGAVLDRPSRFSCTVLDNDTGNIWLSADSAGAAPLWYAFNKGEYSVSTDVISFYHLGMNEPSSVPPGYTIGIDLATQEITHIFAHKASTADSSLEPTQLPALYARQVLIAALESLPATVQESIVMVEVDPLDPTSQLLDCVLDALQANRTIWNTKPLISDDLTYLDMRFKHIIGAIQFCICFHYVYIVNSTYEICYTESISPEFTKTTPPSSSYEPR